MTADRLKAIESDHEAAARRVHHAEEHALLEQHIEELERQRAESLAVLRLHPCAHMIRGEEIPPDCICFIHQAINILDGGETEVSDETG